MLNFIKKLFGSKSVEVKQPEFHEEIRAQVEAGKVKVEVKEGQPQFHPDYNPATDSKKKPAKKTGAKKAPAKPKSDAKKAPAKKSTKSKK